MGTATYFSPEQAQGRQVDPRSDIYSLGCVLFEILTARPPFTGETPVAIAYKHVQEAPPHPGEFVQVPQGLDAIVMKCLAKSPDGRYSSSEELRTDLRRFLEGQPVAALAGAAAAGAATGMAATAAYGAATGMQPGYEATSALPVTGGYPPATGTGPVGPYADGEPEKKPPNPWLIGALVVFLVLLAGGLIALAMNLSKTGGDKVAVPDVIEKTCDEAKVTLRAKGFELNCVRAVNDSAEPNKIFEQSPKPNEMAESGATVTAKYAAETSTVQLPSVIGQTEQQARTTLKDFTVTTGPAEASPTVPAGSVARQSPDASAQVQKGSAVTIYLSSGPSAATIPGVAGRPEKEAFEQLTAAGFNSTTKVPEASNEFPAGVVIRTNPPGGSQVPKETRISVYVSTGPPPTTQQTTTTASTPQTTTTTTTKTNTKSTPTTNG
jgi:beta-lactam-binding protein with PASTA domain